MVSILIKVAGFGALEETSDISITGDARTSDMTNEDPSVSWAATVTITDLASAVNTAIKDAAVNAAGGAGHTVGMLDKKTVLGGAVGL